MEHELFIKKCQELVIERENVGLNSKEDFMTKKEDVFIVWSCKTLQNSKAILSTKLKGAPLYEITMNGDKQEIYVDIYVKESNECISIK